MAVQGIYVKDLTVLKLDLSRVVLVDNNPMSFLAQPSNGIPVPSWYDDPHDRSLLVGRLLPACPFVSQEQRGVLSPSLCFFVVQHVADLVEKHLAHADDVRHTLDPIFELRKHLHLVRRRLQLVDEEEEFGEEGKAS